MKLKELLVLKRDVASHHNNFDIMREFVRTEQSLDSKSAFQLNTTASSASAAAVGPVKALVVSAAFSEHPLLGKQLTAIVERATNCDFGMAVQQRKDGCIVVGD